jgi:glycosyltransferase involved in cell wall biosynthesis
MARVAFISSTFPDYKNCGVGIYAGYLTRALADQGHDIHVITSAIPEINPTHGKVTIHKILKSWQPTELFKLVELFHRIKPDILHINHPTTIAAGKSKVLVNVLPEINRSLWRLPCITTLHEFGRVSMLGKIKMLPMLTGSDVITVTSEFYKNAIQKFAPKISSGKIQILNVGSMFNNRWLLGDKLEQRKRWDLNPQDKVVGFMGFITPPKGFHNLIEALIPLLKKDSRVKVLAISSWNQTSPSYRQKILDMIQKEKIVSQVVFTGFLKDEEMWEALSAVDVCAFPFDYPIEERSSGPLRQAIDRYLPTITFAKNLEYNEFGFQHGKNIWFSPFKDLKKFGEDAEILLNDEVLQKTLSEGAKNLRQVFSFDAVSNQLSRIYSSLGNFN